MTEQTLILGRERHLVATLTAARPGSAPPQWVAVLTNSGVIGRAGPHRMNIRLARQFAAMGIPSIRFDMSGLGDSKRPSGTLPQVEQWVEDTRAVMDVAQEHFGQVRFFMVGFCSGAEVAHLTALQDTRLRAAVLWDFYAFPTRLSRLYKLWHRVQRTRPEEFMDKVRSRLTRTIGKVVPAAAPSAPSLNTGTVTPRHVYISRFNELAKRQFEMFFFYSGGEPEWFAYRGQFKHMFGKQPFYHQVAFDQLMVSDHLITTKAAQLGFAQAVERWLAERVLNR